VDYGAGLERAIEKGWFELHESGTFALTEASDCRDLIKYTTNLCSEAPDLHAAEQQTGDVAMFKDLIKFTAKVAIFAAIVKFVILPHIPGMPSLDDLIHLPSWEQVAKFIGDPGDLFGKSQAVAHWAESKMPDAKVFNQSIPRPNVIPQPRSLPNSNDKPKDVVNKVIDPFGLTSGF